MKRILFAPDAAAGLPAAPSAPAPTPAAPAPSKPSTPAPATQAPATGDKAPAAPTTPEPTPSDDPFQRPKKADAAAPQKPAAASTTKPDDFDRMAPKELRERVKQLREENASYPSKIKALEEKIAQFDARGQDTTALTNRLTAIEKERDEAMAHLRAARQEATPEFKQKYDQPFDQTAERVKQKVSTFTVATPEGERTANWADFSAIYAMPDGPAWAKARELFGDSASQIMGYRDKLQDLDAQRTEALNRERTEYKQRTEAEQAENAKNREWMATTYRNENQRLATANPDYMIDPTDTEALEAQKHALTTFDARPKATDRESAQKVILFDSHVRQKVGIVPVLQLRIERMEAENKSLKEMIDELKGTAGGGARRPSGEAPANEGDDETSWSAAARKAVNAA